MPTFLNADSLAIQKIVYQPWTGTDQQFLGWVYLPAIVWLLLLTVLLILLLKKYTFGKWTAENPNPYALETMGIPRGAFRGMLTLSLLFAVILFEVINIKVGGQFEDQVSGLLTAFQMMIAFYFGAKVMHHITSTDRNKTKVVAASMVATQSPAGDAESFQDEEAAG